MISRTFIKLTLLLLTLGACKKNDVPSAEDLFPTFGLDSNEAFADGSTILRVFCFLNDQTTEDRREVRFSISAGQFLTTKDSVIVAKAQYKEDKLIAEAYFSVPLDGDKIIVTARPNLPDIPHGNNVFYDYVTLKRSLPATLNLQASSSSLASNFEQEVLLTAKVSGENGRNVSSGYRVVFEDKLADGTEFEGYFRNLSEKINAQGQASVYYAIGNAPVGETIQVSCYLLDEAGVKMSITDSFNLFINK